MQADPAQLVGQLHLFQVSKGWALVSGFAALHGEVEATQDHVLGRPDDRLSTGGFEQVSAGKHQLPRLGHGLVGQGYVDGHLVAVKVGVKCSTDQGMDLDRLSIHQHRLESLDAQPVQGRRTVEQHGAILDDFFQHLPDLGSLLFDDPLGALYIDGIVIVYQPIDDKGLEEFEGHAFRQSTLVQRQVGADDNDRPPGIVHTLAQEVAAEATLLALEIVRQRLQWPPSPGRDSFAPAAVVDERVHRFLQHALLIADDDVWRAQIEQPLQAVVAIDHTSVEVVQVRRGKASAIELDHRPQFGWDDGQDAHDHPLRTVVALAEGLNHTQSLGGLFLQLL